MNLLWLWLATAVEEPPTEEPKPTEEAIARQSPGLDPNNGATNEKPSRRGNSNASKYESKQRFSLEVKLGPYIPDIDRNYEGPDEFGPYAKIFGRTDELGRTIGPPKPGVLTAFAFDWQFIYLAGPLGLGYTFSFFLDSAQAPFKEAMEDGTLRSKADRVRFTVLPMALQLTYRFELLADRFRVPIVPYAKAGLAYAFWWSKGGDGKLSVNSQGVKARGGVWGWQINAGGMLRLDFLDLGSSRSLDRATGINHTYIFGEYQLSRINNFGQPGSMNLGDSTWLLGLAIEF